MTHSCDRHFGKVSSKSEENFKKDEKFIISLNFYMILVHFFFKFIRKTWANQFPGCKSTLGSFRGVKTRKTIKNQRFLIIFCSFFPFCRPGVSSKYSYAPESVCPRFSDEFKKKMDQHHVQTEDFPIKAHFLGARKF